MGRRETRRRTKDQQDQQTRRRTRDQQTRRRTRDQQDQQTQRRTQDQGKVCSPDHITDWKLKRKHKCGSSHQGKTSFVSFQGSSESLPLSDIPTECRTQPKLNNHSGPEGSRHPAVPPHHHPSFSGPDPLERHSAEMEDDSTDLSDGEKGSPLPSRVPPQLHLRPEVVENQALFSCSHRTRGQNFTEFQFPDFLPPPFNSWSLSQLAVFYSIECRSSHGLRPMGSLERYLERLLQLEWHQVKTVNEETGTLQFSICQRTSATAFSRLSSPKCILQCQRGFPLSFLSCLGASQRATSGRSAVSTGLLVASSHSATTSPILEGSRAKASLPRRSCSESRTPRLDFQGATSTVKTSSHMKRMQALGNLRNMVHTAPSRPASTAREHSHCLHTLDCRLDRGCWWIASEQRAALERKRKGSESRQSRSECRGGGAGGGGAGGGGAAGGGAGGHYKRTPEFKHLEIKPDTVATTKDNLPKSNTDRAPIQGKRSTSVPVPEPAGPNKW